MTDCCEISKNIDEIIKEIDKDLTGITKPNEKVDNEKTKRKRIEDVNKNEYESSSRIWETKVMKRLNERQKLRNIDSTFTEKNISLAPLQKMDLILLKHVRRHMK